MYIFILIKFQVAGRETFLLYFIGMGRWSERYISCFKYADSVVYTHFIFLRSVFGKVSFPISDQSTNVKHFPFFCRCHWKDPLQMRSSVSNECSGNRSSGCNTNVSMCQVRQSQRGLIITLLSPRLMRTDESMQDSLNQRYTPFTQPLLYTLLNIPFLEYSTNYFLCVDTVWPHIFTATLI